MIACQFELKSTYFFKQRPFCAVHSAFCDDIGNADAFVWVCPVTMARYLWGEYKE